MPQTSGPKTDQTFTDAEWRETIGDEAGIRSDFDGSSYTLTLSTSSDVATVGSATQDSIAVVGGFRHKIVAGQTQEITIPAASSAVRHDLVGLQYDPTWSAVDPGPVRLHRVAGTEGAGMPSYDGSQPGVEFMPLWSVARTPGQALSQASTVDLRAHTGPNISVPTITARPDQVPVGTTCKVRSTRHEFFRTLNDQRNPTWERVRAFDTTTVTTNDSGVAVVGHFLGRVPRSFTAAVTVPDYGTSSEALALAADYVIQFKDAQQVHLRFVDRRTSTWFGRQTFGVMWAAE